MVKPRSHQALIYTDGSIHPNPGGQAGWAFHAQVNTDRETLIHEAGGTIRIHPDNSNNRAEMLAAIEALTWGYEAAIALGLTRVYILTDSEYVSKGFTWWMENWASRNWVKDGRPVKNRDLWVRLHTLRHTCPEQVTRLGFHWVRGHGDNQGNLRADEIAGHYGCDRPLLTPLRTLELGYAQNARTVIH